MPKFPHLEGYTSCVTRSTFVSCLYPASRLSPVFSFRTSSIISSLLFLATLSSCLRLRPHTRSFLRNVLSLCIFPEKLYISNTRICPSVCRCRTHDTCANAPDHPCSKMSCSQLADFSVCEAAVNSVSHKFLEIFVRWLYNEWVCHLI